MGSIVERALLPWAQRVKTRVNLPVRLRWGETGDSSLTLGDFEEPQVDIRVRDTAALPLLINPGLDTLGQAYVEGMVDVDGSLADILAEVGCRPDRSRERRSSSTAAGRGRSRKVARSGMTACGPSFRTVPPGSARLSSTTAR